VSILTYAPIARIMPHFAAFAAYRHVAARDRLTLILILKGIENDSHE
jgi:hypothetical protein